MVLALSLLKVTQDKIIYHSIYSRMSWIQSIIEEPENNTKLKVCRKWIIPALPHGCVFGLPDFVFGFIMILMSTPVRLT